MMKVEKPLARLWAKRMHTTLKCYKENLITLFALEKKLISEKEKANEQAKLNPIDTNINFDNGDELVDLNSIPTEPKPESDKPKSLLDERATELLDRFKSILDSKIYKVK